jgi:nucleoside-diphosphate-sugar epimerase
MKRILITGKNSYVGKSLENWLKNYPDVYSTKLISLRNDSWKNEDFSRYDVVFHVAGIAHIKETKKIVDLYYKVNRDLAYEVSRKAKEEKVKQFIFLSSMSVYGIINGLIDHNSPLSPTSNYGRSKLQAEELIKTLEDDHFKVAILRPPLIYGKGCPGNYNRLAKLALKVPVFPYIENKRSMIYIDNLSEFVRCVIDDCSNGLFFPQNIEYVNTSKMVELIAKNHGKRIIITRLFNPFINTMKMNSTFNKLFGNLVYEKNISKFQNVEFNRFIGFEESIKLTED